MLLAAERSGAVLLSAGAILLLWASVQKFFASSWSGRVISLSELAACVAVLVLPGRAASALLAALFLVFTAVHVRGIRSGATSCQCFGEEDAVDPARAAALTALVVLLAAGAAAVGAPSLRQLASHDAVALAWVPTSALALALTWRVAFSGSAALMQISDGSGRLLETGRTTARGAVDGELLERRSFLLRVAVFGSALAAAPLRYILYPGTALAAVVRPWDCSSGNCTDGYTDFCCQINDGGANVCPESTFAGGWWMCTDYSGRKLCSEQGVRYYVDCNALPGVGFPGGCRCGNDSCSNRRVNCNIFRYGQCNTQIVGTTAVVCRMVVCENPSHISELHCSASLAVDDAVCGHEATCLEPPALELAGAGGV
jgi:hypothetical protein